MHYVLTDFDGIQITNLSSGVLVHQSDPYEIRPIVWIGERGPERVRLAEGGHETDDLPLEAEIGLQGFTDGSQWYVPPEDPRAIRPPGWSGDRLVCPFPFSPAGYQLKRWGRKLMAFRYGAYQTAIDVVGAALDWAPAQHAGWQTHGRDIYLLTEQGGLTKVSPGEIAPVETSLQLERQLSGEGDEHDDGHDFFVAQFAGFDIDQRGRFWVACRDQNRSWLGEFVLRGPDRVNCVYAYQVPAEQVSVSADDMSVAVLGPVVNGQRVLSIIDME